MPEGLTITSPEVQIVVSALVSAIVFMAGGFIYLHRRVELRGDDALADNEALRQNITIWQNELTDVKVKLAQMEGAYIQAQKTIESLRREIDQLNDQLRSDKAKE